MRICFQMFILLSLIAAGCVKAPIKPNQQLCAMAQSNVQQRIGPEFRRVVSAKLLFDDRVGTYGCGIVYERVDEELAEEFDTEIEGSKGANHMVSFVSRVEGEPARFLEIRRTRTAPGPVAVKLQIFELTGDQYLDLIVSERAPRKGSMVDYQAIKVINGDPLMTSEIFEARLLTKTAEGVEILSSWTVDGSGPKPILILRGGSDSKSYRYSPTSRRLLPVMTRAKADGSNDPSSPEAEVPANFNANDLDEAPPSTTEDKALEQ